MAKLGDVLLVPLKDGNFTFCRVREYSCISVYEVITSDESISLMEIIDFPILFSVCVHKSAYGKWRKVGNVELDDRLKKLVPFFRQNKFNLNKCMLQDEYGNERAVSPSECVGIERSAVWDAVHVEQRAYDELNGRESDLAKKMKVVLPENNMNK